MNSRTSMAQREDRIRKTVYVSDIDQQVRGLRLIFELSLPPFDVCKTNSVVLLEHRSLKNSLRLFLSVVDR